MIMFLVQFLNTSVLIDQNATSNHVFDQYLKSFLEFSKVCELDCFDFAWFGTVVNHMSTLLVKYAEEADKEAGLTDKLKLEETKVKLRVLFNTMQVVNNPAPDNRKFIAYLITIHILKIDFIRKNFD